MKRERDSWLSNDNWKVRKEEKSASKNRVSVKGEKDEPEKESNERGIEKSGSKRSQMKDSEK